jgi:hypothetical protein
MTSLKAPFPWFGGKSRVAHIVWDRFGDVPHYIEPFFGSGAVLLKRPHDPRTETINDKDCFVANFWRSVQADPEAVAHYADWPINEADLHARHLWLVNEGKPVAERVNDEAEFFDARIAGWWVWGLSCWIGGGWCSRETKQRPDLGMGRGVHSVGKRMPKVYTNDVHARVPHLGRSMGVHSKKSLLSYFMRLCDRLRDVRVCCGDWERVIHSPKVLMMHGMSAGIFLDPPYSKESGRSEGLYAEDDMSVAHRVREWCIANGDNPNLKIALCGYEGEHEMPDNWDCVAWKAPGGYGNQGTGRGKANAGRERIWFSPHCLTAGVMPLFG